jgi:hypothetical protein
MAKQKVSQSALAVDPADMASLRSALRQMARVAPGLVTQGAQKASKRMADAARPRLASSSKWGHLVAPSIRVSKAREPLIRAGGGGSARAKHSPGDQNKYGDLFFGAEYGVKSDPRWPGHSWKGSGANAGYGMWPAIRAESDAIYRLWVTDLMDSFEQIWSHD